NEPKSISSNGSVAAGVSASGSTGAAISASTTAALSSASGKRFPLIATSPKPAPFKAETSSSSLSAGSATLSPSRRGNSSSGVISTPASSEDSSKTGFLTIS